jgi:hypothetical protein
MFAGVFPFTRPELCTRSFQNDAEVLVRDLVEVREEVTAACFGELMLRRFVRALQGGLGEAKLKHVLVDAECDLVLRARGGPVSASSLMPGVHRHSCFSRANHQCLQ